MKDVKGVKLMKKGCGIALVMGMGAVLGAVQQPAPGVRGATITGQVVDAATRQPLRGAIVSASRVRSDAAPARADTTSSGSAYEIAFRTGLDGRFVLQGVAPGIVNFYVAKTGYLPGPYTSVRPAAEGERIDDVLLTVPPAAAISGRVADDSGAPVPSATVTARAKDAAADRPTRTSSANSDADGAYWIGGLGAGEHTVTVGRLGDSVTVVRDSVQVLDAPARLQPIMLTLAVGEERRSVDLTMPALPRALRTGAFEREPGDGTVSGRVIDTRGRSVSNAQVVMTKYRSPGSEAVSGSLAATTDASGGFQFTDVPPGSFMLRPMRLDYMSPTLSGNLPTMVPVVVASGARVDNLILTLRSGGVISGTVTDEYGDPVSGSVTAIANRPVMAISGSATYSISGLGRSAPVDARGRYRLTGLPPGEYLVGVGATATSGRELHVEDPTGHNRTVAMLPMFYPGVTAESLASPVTVSDDSESGGIDIVVGVAPVATIEVTLTSGRAVHSIRVQQVGLDEGQGAMQSVTTGRTAMTLNAVPAGRYRLIASADPVASAEANDTRLWSIVDVATDGLAPTAVHMHLEPGANISGRLVFDGKPDGRQSVRVWLEPMRLPSTKISLAEGNATIVAASGEITIEGVLPGNYVLQAGQRRGIVLPNSGQAGPRLSSPTWVLRAATMAGRDILDQPIDVVPGADLTDVVLTLTDRISELSGVVTDASGRPSDDVSVVVFSADSRHWWPGSRRILVTRPDTSGRYFVRGLPAGSYVVATASDPISLENPSAVLAPLVRGGVRVTLADGERKLQDLRASRKSPAQH